jgi:hypothetical protein
MQAKTLEVRDEGTFIAMLCVDMNPQAEGEADAPGIHSAQRYLLRRVGYPCDGRPNIVITHLSADGGKACNDPHYWGDRTFAVAHQHIIEHWHELKDGDVVDVQFILGETVAPKPSEREGFPL